jgi:hypothetical protein
MLQKKYYGEESLIFFPTSQTVRANAAMIYFGEGALRLVPLTSQIVCVNVTVKLYGEECLLR